MSKVPMRTLESVTGNDAAATALINQNFKDLQDAIDNTVSRDGSTPNYMDADFDLNNKRLINLADPVDDHDAIHKKYFTDTIGDAASYATAAAVSANAAASSAQSAAVSAATAIAELQAAEAVINAAVANAVNTAAGQAQSDIANYVNTTVEPSLQNSVNAAYNYSLDSYNYANSASNSANASYNYSLASYSYSNNSSGFANNSSNSASASLGYANSASNYANSSSNYANSSSNYANNANVWAEGTDVEVTALGGEHSAKGWAQRASQQRNIGEIVASTIPLTDAGLHLLDGALISGLGSYADFVTYIAGLVSDYPDLFETEANWQTAVTTYGVCGKFVYDSVNNTVRLPKITGFVEGTTDLTALGNLVEAGLPNITGSFFVGNVQYANGNDWGGTISGAFTRSTGNGVQGASYTARGATYSIDASLSSSIYGNSTTVQPQAIKVLYYIVMANKVKTQIEVDIDQVMTDVNAFNISKANINMDNISSVGKETVIGWGMPDWNSGVSKSASFTADYDGYVYVKVTGGYGDFTIKIAGKEIAHHANSSSNVSPSYFLPITKGSSFSYTRNSGDLSLASVVFYPLKGVN